MRTGRAVLAGGACAISVIAVVLAYSGYAGMDQQEITRSPSEATSQEIPTELAEPVAERDQPVEATMQEQSAAENSLVDQDIMWAEVTRVVDGDTVHLDGESHRLVLVNTPERGEPGFAEAGEFVKDMCLDKTVAYDLNDPQPTDRYDRYLSLVYCDGPLQPSINELLIEAGHSDQYTRFCSESEFTDQEWTGC